MGAFLSCIEDVPSMQRLRYDMTPIKSKYLPIIWLVGPPGSGRNTQGKMLSENLEFSHIKVADLLREEADNDTDRGRLINEALHHRSKKIPDSIVIDLIKEEMLRNSVNCKGYIINNFPRNSKQAALFIKEIDDVDAIIYLSCDVPVMVRRKKIKSEGRLDEEVIKKSITSYMKEIKEGTSKYGSKIEKIRANEDANEVYTKIEAAISVRISTRTRISNEADYAQSQENESVVSSV
ncbi:adenylate kinase isoenzyme 1 isoform X2 [Tribolium castaneum]|uniref:Adenylate kinase isoenzyme 1-like Protein n=1 Tax=Tribolium castaneum TaxID=7070 RepID=A0A139WI72_TRICA|nr:PREDICTED: adenylate kinase isoenzyme 1 isoform X2 [Tribolium castaneum]KYB27609.1 Adenylate kinase isoenzyme 1-like Protein [Tribolium castaneum]|eukprot:XP_001814182.1 PREDICTED: adenylate kinase isoenzyme 1 isoform X2 [Tribolium castaneum]